MIAGKNIICHDQRSIWLQAQQVNHQLSMFHGGILPKHTYTHISHFFKLLCSLKLKNWELRQSIYLSTRLCFYEVTMAHCLMVGRHYGVVRLPGCSLVTSLELFACQIKWFTQADWATGRTLLNWQLSGHHPTQTFTPALECGNITGLEIFTSLRDKWYPSYTEMHG